LEVTIELGSNAPADKLEEVAVGNDERLFAGIEEVAAAIKALTEAVERASHAELAKLDQLIATQSRLPDMRMIENDMSWIKTDVSQIRDHLLS
jgi:hypothetical protein